jgi:hypothetical protein
MNESDYIEQRLQEQLKWYEENSASNQSRYRALRLTEFSCAALIPFMSGMGDRIPCGPWVIGILGVAIAIAAAAGSIFKFHENWIQYRTTAEQLKHEKFLYLTETHPYDDAEKFASLVQRVENLLSKENSSWAQVEKKPAKGRKSPQFPLNSEVERLCSFC